MITELRLKEYMGVCLAKGRVRERRKCLGLPLWTCKNKGGKNNIVIWGEGSRRPELLATQHPERPHVPQEEITQQREMRLRLRDHPGKSHWKQRLLVRFVLEAMWRMD